MERIESKSLKDQVSERLRAAIVNGELKPGQQLVASELAVQLGVSNATLREAIQTLSVEGLVDTVPYRVPTVKTLSRKDIEDLFSVRGMLEAFATRRILASEQLPQVVDALRRICERMGQAAEQDDLRDLTAIDREFHETLIRHSDNDLLAMLWNSVSLRVQQVMSLRNQKKGDLQQIARNHLAIVEAIAAQDVDLSVQLITEHVGSVADAIADAWHD